MIKQEQWHGTDLYILENEELSLSLCPSVGNNVIRIYDKKAGRDVLRAPDSLETLLQKPVHYGTPVLIPPNRIRGGYFKVGNQEYQLDKNEKNNTGNHIHGFVVGRPWEVTGHNEDGETLSITSVFSTSKYPELMKQYPHELTVEMTYELRGSTLLQKVTARNSSEIPAPFGYGLHTWFLLDNEPDRWKLQLPVSGTWELGGDLMPTGTILPLGEMEGLNEGMSLEGVDLDNVFQIGDHQPLAVLARDGYEIRYVPSGEYKQWVIYTMGTAHNFICLEPYTWVTNAPNLDMDPETTGFRTIAPGESLNLEVLLEINRK
ncbi:aldose 1-epimerase [Paenibacillus sp. J2TS4]|uniref:aldose 1-epimerase n=1 Tax=Paenibacillus sp. J2TS4 TaxID=2807194 RepID=UPI001B20CD88|nr:aldose 1-epimerase [Paenibacillus sp. J2TS4]GIP31132.1 aldose 1-epimerase [Paenibacillus sp. J2TS4]